MSTVPSSLLNTPLHFQSTGKNHSRTTSSSTSTLPANPLPTQPKNPDRTTLSSALTSPAATLLPPSVQSVIPLRSIRDKVVNCYTKAPNPYSKKFPHGIHGKGKLNAFLLDIPELPKGWQEYVHPDGKPYFRQADWGVVEVVTEVNVRDSKSLQDLHNLYTIINECWTKYPASSIAGKYELYLAIEATEPQGNYYYFVEHVDQVIFWLDDMPLKTIVGDSGPSTMSYELFILQNYYSHLENFPCHNELPHDAINFLQSALIYICTDHMTSGESATSPWNSQEAKDFLDLLSELEETHRLEANAKNTILVPSTPFSQNRIHRTWYVARLTCVVLQNRLVRKHGMINARTDRLLSLKPSFPGFLHHFASALTLFAHTTYAQRFENLWIDGVVSSGAWRRLLSSLFTEWTDSNLLATVVLSANMAFLALPGLSKGGKITSILSTVFSIGSIIIGLHHIWRFRDKRETSARQARTYLRNAARLTGNLRPLSFFLSLPFSFLSWSIVTFACSVLMYASQVVKIYFSLVVLAFMLVILTLTILFFWMTFT